MKTIRISSEDDRVVELKAIRMSVEAEKIVSKTEALSQIIKEWSLVNERTQKEN